MNQLAIPLALPPTSAESVEAGRRGIKRATRSNSVWLATVLESLRGFCVGRHEIRIEDFRAWWMAQGSEAPVSHHAWGALAQAAVRAGYITFIRFEKAKSIATHGHPVRVYERGPRA